MKEGTGAMAEKIVDAIITNLTDRRGLRDAWDSVDEDIQAECRGAWINLARRVIEAGR